MNSKKLLVAFFVFSVTLCNAELIELVADKVRAKFPVKCEKTIKADPKYASVSPEVVTRYCNCGTDYLVKNTDNLQWIKGYADANKNPLPWLQVHLDAAAIQCKSLLK